MLNWQNNISTEHTVEKLGYLLNSTNDLTVIYIGYRN